MAYGHLCVVLRKNTDRYYALLSSADASRQGALDGTAVQHRSGRESEFELQCHNYGASMLATWFK
jgi:hypothetical protein